MMVMAHDITEYLDTIADKDDNNIDIGLAALSIAARNHPDRSMDRYLNHLEQMKQKTGERFRELAEAGADDSAGTRLAALKHALHDDAGYNGDHETYDNIDNADLIEVIERHKGLPVTLAILYICCGEAQGWHINGLNFPAHFLCRIEYAGERIIFDPFNGCATLEAPHLRELLKTRLGDNAELSADFYEPISHRSVLIRLQNNIKLRLIEVGDYKKALETVEIMRRIDPDEYRLLLDAGVLYARTGQPKRAIPLLEDYITKSPNTRDREEAALMLRQLKDNLN